MNRAASFGEEGAYLPDRAGDGGTVHAIEKPEDCMRQIVPQMNESHRQPVDEHQLMLGAGASCPPSGAATCRVPAAFDTGQPLPGQLLDQTCEMTLRYPGEHPMRENQPLDHDRHTRIMPPPAITPHPLSRTNS